MASGINLPLGNDVPSYKFKTSLSGVVYTLQLNFNTRVQLWHLDIMDASNNPIYMGIPLIIDTDLLYQCVNPLRPLGTMVVLDTTNQEQNPGRNSFGTTHILMYIDPLGVQ